MQIALATWMVLAGLALLSLGYRVARFFEALGDLSEIQPTLRTKWPRVSLIVPACNEAETIRPALESLLKLDYPNFEIIAVNDRSTDGTSQILHELAAKDERLKAIDVKVLPDGWLGKVHALWCGQNAATGEWFLFTDADVHLGKDTLKKAITVCLQRTYDFLCVVPAIIAKPLTLKFFIAQFFQNAAYSLNVRRIENPHLPDCAGAGAFNLVHRGALERSKGFEWLRMEVVDDVGLAQTVKEAGARLGLLGGKNEVDVEWYGSLKGFIRGVEKNSFSVFQYSLVPLFGFIFSAWFVVGGFLIAPFFAASFAAKLFVFCCLILYLVVAGLNLPRAFYTPAWVVVAFPFTAAVLPLFVLRAAVITRRQNGIYWRETFYGLTELKRNQRLRPISLFFGTN